MPANSVFHYSAEVLQHWRGGLTAEAALRDFIHRHPRFPQEGRRKVAHAVHAYFRWLQWLPDQAPLPEQIEEASGWQERFERDPRQIKAAALEARAVPPWVWEELDFGAGADASAAKAAWLRSLQLAPPIWLRARPGGAREVAKQLGNCGGTPTPLCPDALRYNGRADLYLSEPFARGDFEIQDLASQFVGTTCAPQPGATWWDACAGEGGKALHLADLMLNKGTVWCSDRSARRLQALRRRFGRAQLFNYRVAAWEGGARLPTKTKFDGVLVDAPCSGLGTWARHPDARWTTTSNDVAELAAIQRDLLAHVAPAVKPGGRLIYAVCTLTRRETIDIAAAFTAAHPDFTPLPLPGPTMSTAVASRPASPASHDILAPLPNTVALETAVTLWPQTLASNGMFVAVWRRN